MRCLYDLVKPCTMSTKQFSKSLEVLYGSYPINPGVQADYESFRIVSLEKVMYGVKRSQLGNAHGRNSDLY